MGQRGQAGKTPNSEERRAENPGQSEFPILNMSFWFFVVSWRVCSMREKRKETSPFIIVVIIIIEGELLSG